MRIIKTIGLLMLTFTMYGQRVHTFPSVQVNRVLKTDTINAIGTKIVIEADTFQILDTLFLDGLVDGHLIIAGGKVGSGPGANPPIAGNGISLSGDTINNSVWNMAGDSAVMGPTPTKQLIFDEPTGFFSIGVGSGGPPTTRLHVDNSGPDTEYILFLGNGDGNIKIGVGVDPPNGVISGEIGNEFTHHTLADKYFKQNYSNTDSGWVNISRHDKGFMGFADSMFVVPCTQNVYSKITNTTFNLWSQGALTTPDITYAGDSIQVNYTANYTITWSASFGGANSDHWHIAIFVNGVRSGACGEIDRDMTSTSVGVGASVCFMPLSSGDVVSLRAKNTINDGDFTISAGSFYIEN